LECGTYRGWSTCWAALALPDDGKVYTFDPRPPSEFLENKQHYWKNTNLAEKIIYIQSGFEKVNEYSLLITRPLVVVIDGPSGYELQLQFLNSLKSHLEPGDFFFTHDANTDKGTGDLLRLPCFKSITIPTGPGCGIAEYII
jgi:predicted O-methyltransferase YrrM